MKSSDEQLTETLWQFSQAYINEYQQKKGCYPVAEIDPDSVSPCQIKTIDEQNCSWQAVKIEQTLNFDNVASALEVNIHADVCDYYCSIYSDSIAATSVDGKLSLLFAWNFADFERLQENMIGHIMMKQQLKQTITIFFAVTDEEDMIISLNNDNGEIWLEQIGCEPHRKLANSMQEFITGLNFDIESI